jgi:hypothetical protein
VIPSSNDNLPITRKTAAPELLKFFAPAPAKPSKVLANNSFPHLHARGRVAAHRGLHFPGYLFPE